MTYFLVKRLGGVNKFDLSTTYGVKYPTVSIKQLGISRLVSRYFSNFYLMREDRNEFILELRKILPLLKSIDFESQKLGYSLYQESSFRKYVRNKFYAYKDAPNLISKFPLTSLANEKISDRIMARAINNRKIKRTYDIIVSYIKNKIIIYDNSFLKRKRIRRI